MNHFFSRRSSTSNVKGYGTVDLIQEQCQRSLFVAYSCCCCFCGCFFLFHFEPSIVIGESLARKQYDET